MKANMNPFERAYKLIQRHSEAADMVRQGLSTDYIRRFGHVSPSTVTNLRKAIALTEGNYGNHSNNFDYKDWY